MLYPYENLENFTLRALLNRSVELYADEDALGKVGEKAISYKEFNTLIGEMVTLLQDNGIQKGDKVLLLSENLPNWSVAYFAVTYFGAVIVPVLPDFHASDVHRIIKHSDAKAAFVSKKFQKTIEDATENSLKFTISLDSLDIIDSLSDSEYMSNLKATQELTLPQEEDLASLIYTSGTTGNSKGVMLSHKNIVTNALSAHNHIKISKEDVWLSVLPLAHTFECTVGLIVPLLHGSSIYYIDKVPTPSVLMKAFKTIRPTMMVSVPLIIEKIYKSKILPQLTGSSLMKFLYSIGFIRKILNKAAGKKLLESFGGRLRFFGVGGAGISPFVEQFLIEAKFPYTVGYGLTETAPLVAGSIQGKKIKLKSTGVALAGVALKIRNKDPKTGNGEIILKSPSVMMGYYNDEEKTAEVMEDGWFLTGDLGYIDDEGYLFINGRSKNVLIGSGGENIYPEQIESMINKYSSIDSSLMMHKDNQLIARIHLDKEKMTDAQLEDIPSYLEELRKEVNSQVSSFSKMVKFIEEVEPFVITPTKKIKRYLYA
ncbi:MAG: AMP-binding protein [Sulfurimonas sp.]|nr:AMP-binding protein [Sulfurimonas sp.]MDQ7061947.1 AMP-binding protein [Sulfurimonas sp.]